VLKQDLHRNGRALGAMVMEFLTPGMPAIIAATGAEFALFDMEHTGASLETMKTMIAGCRGLPTAPLVRVPRGEYHFIARALDIGAHGIMVPMVGSAAEAAHIASCAHYPPAGRRGAAFGVAHDDYIASPVTEVMASANKEGFIAAKIETVAGIENCEAIAAVEGIDCLWVGHFDLSVSMGIPAQFDHPAFLKAIEKVPEACEKHGKTAGNMVINAESAQVWKDFGYRAFAYLGDVWLYQNALKQGLEELKTLD
jgi:2-keto-3-deoxy-L-rhamnonate aldolase RhmA